MSSFEPSRDDEADRAKAEFDCAIDTFKHNAFTDPDKISDAEALGALISQHLGWDGQAIFEAARAAFEDANFRMFNKSFEKAWALENARGGE
jgi:hypothetical protein